jgi:hypothetical protein
MQGRLAAELLPARNLLTQYGISVIAKATKPSDIIQQREETSKFAKGNPNGIDSSGLLTNMNDYRNLCFGTPSCSTKGGVYEG